MERDEADAIEFERRAHEISRRALLAMIGVGAAAGTVGLDAISAPSAQAAVSWFHPFTTPGRIPSGGTFNSWVLDDGSPRTTQHKGLDYDRPGAGSSIYSVASGTVNNQGTGGSYGNWVEINHSDGYQSLYAHMQAGSIAVANGQAVAASTLVGLVGSTGDVTGAHLHVEIRLNGTKVDPYPLIDSTNAPLASTAPVSYSLGDDMTDLFYYVSGTGSYTTNGVKTPAVTVVPNSLWYQERPGAPLFRVTDNYTSNYAYQGNLEYLAFNGARFANTAATRASASATEVGKLIELRGETLQSAAALAPLRTA